MVFPSYPNKLSLRGCLFALPLEPMGNRSLRRSLDIEGLEARLPLTAQLAVDGSTAPVVAAQFASVGSEVYFSTTNGSEAQIRRFDGANLTTVAEHRFYTAADNRGLGFLLEVGDGVMYGFSAPFFLEDIAAATFEVWYASADTSPQLVRELPVMNAFGQFSPPTDASSIGGNLLIRDASARYQLINPAGITIATWSAPIEGRCGNPVYGPVHVDGGGLTIEAAYPCSTFVTPLFVRTEGQRLEEVETHPTSLYLPNGTLVTSEFTRESLAEELMFDTIAGRQSISVDGRPVKPEAFTRLGDDQVFFSGDDGTHGREPWITDGTISGTRLLRDISADASSNPSVLGQTPHGIVFSAFSDNRGIELWITDGTTDGTELLRDIAPGLADSNPVSITQSLDQHPSPTGVIFFWVDGPDGGRELWATDGTSEGTEQIIETSLPIDTELTATLKLADGTTALGLTDQQNHSQAWISDGTTRGTQQLRSLPSSAEVVEFSGSQSNSQTLVVKLENNEIWHLTPPTDEAVRVWSNTIDGDTAGLHPQNITAFGERILFTTDEASSKSRVWLWDPGTEELMSPGIIAIGSDMTISVLGSNTAIFTEFNTIRVLQNDRLSALGTQLFLQHESTSKHSYMLWSTHEINIVDANRQQTRPEGKYFHLTVNGDTLYALSEAGSITKFEGTAATVVSGPIFGPDAKLYRRSAASLWVAQPDKIQRFDINTGRVAQTWPIEVAAEDVVVAESGQLFWRNVANRSISTIRANEVVDLMGTRDLVDIEEMTVVGSRIFFVGVNTRGKRSLWTSDGTPAGSQRLALIAGLTNLTTDGQKLYFTAEQSIWESDGTTLGTKPTPIVASEQINATADELQVIGTDLYFAASDGTHGNELFFAELAPAEVKLGDADRDGSVDFADFLILSAHFGVETTNDGPDADFDNDGQIGFSDFLLLSSNFGS